MLTKWHESEFDLEIAYARAVLLQSSAAARTAVFLIFLQRDSCEILPAKFGLTSMLIDCPSVARGVQRIFFSVRRLRQTTANGADWNVRKEREKDL